jgi:hypothetical protein
LPNREGVRKHFTTGAVPLGPGPGPSGISPLEIATRINVLSKRRDVTDSALRASRGFRVCAVTIPEAS